MSGFIVTRYGFQQVSMDLIPAFGALETKERRHMVLAAYQVTQITISM
jgi:hypothetical protein